MANPRNNARSSQHPERSQSTQDVMASMMSPATKLLLANMNRSRRVVASPRSNNKNDNSLDNISNGPLSCKASNDYGPAAAVLQRGRRRRPLDAIHANKNNNNYKTTTDAMASKITTATTTAASSSKQQIKSNNRTIGPHEVNYTQNYDAYITQIVHRYESKQQSNIGKPNSSVLLPSYKRMNGQQRIDAMNNVDNLLERLTLKNKGGGAVASLKSASSMMEDGDEDETIFLDTRLSNHDHDDDGGGAVAADNHTINQSFGSATTMGGYDDNHHQNHNNNNKSTSSETTMMEQSMSLLGSTTTTSHNNTTTHKSIMDGTTTMEQSMSLLGGKSSSSVNNNDDSDVTTAYEQSMSLLGNESHLLFSPSGNGGIDDDDESRFSRGGDLASAGAGAAPIEKVRRYNNSNDDDRMMTSPQLFTSSYNNKRCASNSGKRGLKSRFRYQDDNDDGGDFTADDSLLQHFNPNSNDGGGVGVGGDGMFFPSQEDEFSPIQHRFSHDGLESDCGIERYDDDDDDDGDDDDDPSRDGKYNDGDCRFQGSKLLSYQQEGGGEDDDISFGCNDGGFDDDDEEDDGGGFEVNNMNNNWTQSSRLLTQQHQSQWSTFKTVDPSTQTNEEDSPVERRAIRFESTQKGYSRHQMKQRQREQEVVFEDDNEKIQSLRDELTDMAAVRDHQLAGQDDDPIQTVGNLCRRATSCHEEGMDTSLLDEVAPIDVRLRDGHLFHKDPLQCRQVQKKKSSSKVKSKGTKTVRIAKASYNDRRPAASDSEESLSDADPSFKDPTSSFPSRVADRLNGAFDFMMKKNDQSTTSSAIIYPDDDCGDRNVGLLLSLDLKQTMAVTSKLLLITKKLARSHQNSKNRKTASTPSTATTASARDGDYLAGGTLIILRAKEDIPTWEAALREYTSLSVFSHNSLQANQRKHASAAAKCAVYDVVLTTYDLLKGKDATIPVDSLGKAILKSDSNSNADDGGWLKTRGSETQSGGEAKKTCLQLSILHRMSWYRVIMMDSLGRKGDERKGYLTKPNTARAEAARAVNSLSRFIFFVKEEEDDKMEKKFKNDRKQIKSVLQALHLPPGTTAKTFLGRWAHDVKSNVKESSLDSSSCDDRSMTDDYGSDNESLSE
jgi:hypothetical protein